MSISHRVASLAVASLTVFSGACSLDVDGGREDDPNPKRICHFDPNGESLDAKVYVRNGSGDSYKLIYVAKDGKPSNDDDGNSVWTFGNFVQSTGTGWMATGGQVQVIFDENGTRCKTTIVSGTDLITLDTQFSSKPPAKIESPFLGTKYTGPHS